MTLAFLNIGTQEMMLIIIVILFLFGGKKLPELARGLGRGIREFKDASDGIKRELSDQINNFERDLDVSDKDSDTVSSSKASATTDLNEQIRDHAEPKAETTIPQFAPPAGTHQHNPNTTVAEAPVDSPAQNDADATTKQA